MLGFIADDRSEIEGLDRTEHGEVGFDLGGMPEAAPATATSEPRAAQAPP